MTALLSCVTSEGGLLHPELLQRIVVQDAKLPGLTPGDYHLDVRLGEAASRAWGALQSAWRAFRFKLARVPEGEPATAVTRDAWLLPLFRELGWGTLATAGESFRIEGQPMSVSHGYGHVPVHLVGARVSIDKRPPPGATKAVRTSPHGLVQDLLNRSDDHLWGIEPGRPLSFLDAHVQHGNALLGATPALLARGIPEEAYEPIEGDDKKVASALRKQNKKERETIAIDFSAPPPSTYLRLGEVARLVDAASDTSLADVRAKEKRYQELVGSGAFDSARFLADLWCAAFVWRKEATERGEVSALRDLCPTEASYRRLADEPLGAAEALRAEVRRLREVYGFFHWHLAFPQVLRPRAGALDEGDPCGWDGGFDVVLGNPPWEKVKLVEKEFFAERVPSIAQAPTAAAREGMIRAIRKAPPGDPLFAIARAFEAASRHAEGTSHLLRRSGRFPLCGKGDVNTYAVFAELDRALVGEKGRAGFIVPSGIATDDTTKEFFAALIEGRELASFLSFENEERVFVGVHHQFKFALTTLGPRGSSARAELLFFARNAEATRDPSRRFSLSGEEFALLNPNTRTCPTFRSRRDAEINLALYRRVPVLSLEPHQSEPALDPWRLQIRTRLWHMAEDSSHFHSAAALLASGWTQDGNVFANGTELMLPLYEAKMVHLFDHRFSTYEGATQANLNVGTLPRLDAAAHADPLRVAIPEHWVAATSVDERLAGVWDRGWLLAWRDIARSVDERTLIPSLVPRVPVGHTSPLMFPGVAPPLVAAFYASLCSFLVDYAARQKVGGTHVAYSSLKQLPIIPAGDYLVGAKWQRDTLLRDFILPRTLELTYTAWDLAPFAKDCGYDGPPFRWDPERRALLRAELDAAFFHLYGLPRDDVAYVMETFPIVKRRDEAAHGEFRTKRLILERFDAMAEAAATATPYQTVLDPPPADPRVAHPSRPT